MMTKENRIILLSEVLESKLRKERELEYYQAELIRIQENFDLLYYASWTNDFKDGFLTNYPKT